MKLEIFSTISDDESAWYGDVTPGGVSQWISENGPKAGDTVEIAINSYGGSVFAGMAIVGLLRETGARLVAHVYGVAASMASVIACAADELVMDAGSYLMIHNPSAVASGESEDLRTVANLLDGLRGAAVRHYLSKKLCATAEECVAMMDGGDTWLSAEQCVDRGMTLTVVAAAAQRVAAECRGINLDTVPEPARLFIRPAATAHPPAPEPSLPAPQGDGKQVEVEELTAELTAERDAAVARAEAAEAALENARKAAFSLGARDDAAPESWPEAVAKCGGYAEAIKRYPELAKAFRQKALERSRVSV